MSAPSLMYEHGLDVPKGWFEMAALDFAAKMHIDVTIDVPAGRVAHVFTLGREPKDRRFKLGVSGRAMAVFLWQGTGDYDVANPGTTPGGLFMHRAVAPTGVINGLVAKGAYEIQSTEFDTTKTYAANDLLTALTGNTLATSGVLTNAGSGGDGKVRQYVDAACGCVAAGAFKNAHGVDVLDFWPVYLPAVGS